MTTARLSSVMAAEGQPLDAHKEKRLLLVAQKAGALEIKAMDQGDRNRAYHFMRRMYRLLQVMATLRAQRERSHG